MMSSYELSHDPQTDRLKNAICQYPAALWTSLVTWQKAALVSTVVASLAIIAIITSPGPMPHYKIAFIGNSMMYYNDFPRFMEALSDSHVSQDCCLHGDATLSSILTWGSGTYQIWHTGVARMDTDDAPEMSDRDDDNDDYLNANDSDNDDENANDDGQQQQQQRQKAAYSTHRIVYDMGACTVPQLLFGYDEDLATRVEELYGDAQQADDDDNNNNNNKNNADGDDFFSYNDGKNPCLKDPSYYYFRQEQYELHGPPSYDFIVLNDRTRSPARRVPRNETLEILDSTYIDWFLETGATPVFLVTYGYDTPYRDMSGLVDVPTFTSYTYEGYKEYAELVASQLPKSQKPRLAPVALAFLMVWEENFGLWQKLFHIDQIHASPHGTFLQGCVVHHTIFGRLPPRKAALRNDMSALWDHARRMQPRKHRRLPMPTQEEAEYLYHIAERVCVRKQLPQSFIQFKHKNASEYVPNDGAYADNDIYR